jgi:hypothetical protein
MGTSDLPHPPRRRGRRPLAVVAAVGASVALLASCAKATETGIEQVVESQTGEDVDLDVDDDGSFSVETDEGGMTVDEDGNFVITDENGETITGNAGDEDGDYAIETEDGDFRMDASGDVPDEWPDEVPEPAGISGGTASVQTIDDQLGISFGGSAGEGFIDEYAAALEDAGFEQISNFESAENATRIFEDATWTVTVSSYGTDGDVQTSVSLFSK